jgi:hypothetical protein
VRRLLWILGAAALTLIAADLSARALAPPRHLREVEDAIRDLRHGDPTVLAIGSSHARTFHVMDDSLRQRTAGRERILSVPVEWGKLSSYRWVLEQRLLPLLDERDAAGTPRRPSLRRAIIVTEWWDSCRGDSLPRNLPARSWTWRHYVADVRANGLTDYNGNYLGNRWSRAFRWSALVQDRGHGFFTSALRQRLLPSAQAAAEAHYANMVSMWQAMVEGGQDCIGSPYEMDALRAMLDTLQGRGLEVTILLYPRMPITLTAQAKATTLPQFAEMIQSLGAARDVRVVDLTTGAPLTDADFGGDFDHLLPPGNARVSGWALDGPLRFLLEARR